MNYSQMPLALPSLPALQKKQQQESKIPDDPETQAFMKNIPENGPYRIMVTKLPKDITKAQLEEEFSKLQIKDARIQFDAGNEHCFLHFRQRLQCLQAKGISGHRIHGSLVQLKLTSSGQQQELRRVNTAVTSGGVSGRFKNLSGRGSSIREPSKKHSYPVGGSIRPKRTNNIKSAQAPKQNPWDSGSRPRTNDNNQKPQILRRNQSSLNQPRRGPGVQGQQGRRTQAPQRQTQAPQQRQQREDERMNFRNRNSDGPGPSRADTATNWRNSGSKAQTRTSPRNRTPESRRKTDSNSRRQRDHVNTEGFINSRQKIQSIQRRKKEEDQIKPKQRHQNAFAMLDHSDDEN